MWTCSSVILNRIISTTNSSVDMHNFQQFPKKWDHSNQIYLYSSQLRISSSLFLPSAPMVLIFYSLCSLLDVNFSIHIFYTILMLCYYCLIIGNSNVACANPRWEETGRELTSVEKNSWNGFEEIRKTKIAKDRGGWAPQFSISQRTDKFNSTCHDLLDWELQHLVSKTFSAKLTVKENSLKDNKLVFMLIWCIQIIHAVIHPNQNSVMVNKNILPSPIVCCLSNLP